MESKIETAMKSVYCGYRSCYDHTLYPSNRAYPLSGLSLFDGKMFNAYLKADIGHDRKLLELPCVIGDIAERALLRQARDIRDEDMRDRLLFPVHSTHDGINKSTFSSVLTGIFSKRERTFRMNVVNTQDKTYVGGPGLLMEKDMTPLVLCSLMAERTPGGTDKQVHFRYVKAVCRIHPKVVEDGTDCVCRGIMRKLVPYYAKAEFLGRGLKANAGFDSSLRPCDMRIIISREIEDFILRPCPPRPGKDIDSELNGFLVDNADEILGRIADYGKELERIYNYNYAY